MMSNRKLVLFACILACTQLTAEAVDITVDFSFDLTTAIAPLSVGDTITGSLTYDDTVAFQPSISGFPFAITSLTLETGGATGTFLGTDFDDNSVGTAPSFFAAQFFSPNLSSDLPFDLANFAIGFPQQPLPASFDPEDLSTYVSIFPNTFTFQMTYDNNVLISEGTGLATVVPEPTALFPGLLLVSAFLFRRRR